MTASRKLKNDTDDSSANTTEQQSPLTFDDLTQQIHEWLLGRALRELRHQRGGALIVGRREWRFHPSAIRLHLPFRRRFGLPPVEAGEGE